MTGSKFISVNNVSSQYLAPSKDRHMLNFRLMAVRDIHSFLYKNVVFLAQVEYSYFAADFRLKILLCYS